MPITFIFANVMFIYTKNGYNVTIIVHTGLLNSERLGLEFHIDRTQVEVSGFEFLVVMLKVLACPLDLHLGALLAED